MSHGGQDIGTDTITEQRGETPINNQAQNEQVNSIARELNLNKSQREQLHRRIGHQGMDYEDVLEEAKDIKERRKGEKPWKQNRRK